MPLSRVGAALLIVLALANPLFAQDVAATPHAEAPPTELSALIREQLADSGTRVTVGEAALDFWWVKALPLRPDAQVPPGLTDTPWARTDEGVLTGAVRVSAPMRDIRGRTVKPGVYTLRRAVQPANGDHLGVSPYREFLLLSPAAVDVDVAPTGHEGTIELSKRTLGISHPAVLSLDPLQTTAPPLTVHETDYGHRTVIFEIATTAGEGAGGPPLRFGVIVLGVYEV